MHSLLIDNPSRLLDWAERELDVTFFGDARALGWGNDEEIRAVAVYERWSGNDACVHLVSDNKPGWLCRQFLASGFYYPFVTGGLRRITGLVPANNERAIRLNQHFGYREEGRMRFGVDDETDLIVMGMLKEECRFIPKEFRHG